MVTLQDAACGLGFPSAPFWVGSGVGGSRSRVRVPDSRLAEVFDSATGPHRNFGAGPPEPDFSQGSPLLQSAVICSAAGWGNPASSVPGGAGARLGFHEPS